MPERTKPEITHAGLQKVIHKELKKLGLNFAEDTEFTREDIHRILNELEAAGRARDIIVLIVRMEKHLSEEYGDLYLVEQTQYREIRNCFQDLYKGLYLRVEYGKKGTR